MVCPKGRVTQEFVIIRYSAGSGPDSSMSRIARFGMEQGRFRFVGASLSFHHGGSELNRNASFPGACGVQLGLDDDFVEILRRALKRD